MRRKTDDEIKSIVFMKLYGKNTENFILLMFFFYFFWEGKWMERILDFGNIISFTINCVSILFIQFQLVFTSQDGKFNFKLKLLKLIRFLKVFIWVF